MGKMKLAYYTMDGRLRFQNVNLRETQIQFPDGNHPVTDDCVSYDPKGIGQPVITYLERITPPLGTKLAHKEFLNMLYAMSIRETIMKNASVNKMWFRALQNGVEWLMTYGITLTIVLAVMGTILLSLIGGGR